ncbi:MAG: glycosyltransferase [Chthoniobacterales bacterium]|nr:glycosyltransferase [Chthoniobacterales bacterium]
MITTNNRSSDLRQTLFEIAKLNPQPNEILICADGCTDGTTGMLQSEFPHCKVMTNQLRRGSIYSRDVLLRTASSDIVVSLDDDSYPMDRDFLPHLVRIFVAHPDAGVITFVELRGEKGEFSGPAADLKSGRFVAAYPNCAAAMRREVYLKSDGFPVFFGHMYEEPDYALQCYALGFGVWFEPTLRVRHYLASSRDDQMPRHHLQARNEVWSVWLRCPLPWVLVMTIYRVARQFLFAALQGFGWAMREPYWWKMAVCNLRQVIKNRRAVSSRIYFGWLRLGRKPEGSARDLSRIFGDC